MPIDIEATAILSGGLHSTKQWSHLFPRNRIVADRPFTDTYDETGNILGLLAAFLQQAVISVPSAEVERCKVFFMEVQNRPISLSLERRAWVHNHRKSSLTSGGRPGWMTSSEVFGALKYQVNTVFDG
jgi:hypothetical protein